MLSVILPIHNEEENILPLLQELAVILRGMPDAEVIAVNDGSTDGTQNALLRALQDFPFLRVIELARRYGQTAAIAAGMDGAKGDILLPMDSDGQNDPADIPLFLEKLDQGYDVVSGWRKDRKDAWLRSLLSRFANALIRRASAQNIHDYGCTMKAYRRATLESVGLYGDMHRFLAAYAAVQGARIAEVAVHHRPRLRGQSKYGFSRIWRVILDLVMLTFTLRSFTRPMQFFGAIGLVALAAGVLTMVVALVWRFAGGPTLIQTPLPVLAALFVIVAVQCTLMGVLAEMSMRTYFQSTGRKPYFTRSQASSQSMSHRKSV